jgi:hypothetical protein
MILTTMCIITIAIIALKYWRFVLLFVCGPIMRPWMVPRLGRYGPHDGAKNRPTMSQYNVSCGLYWSQ